MSNIDEIDLFGENSSGTNINQSNNMSVGEFDLGNKAEESNSSDTHSNINSSLNNQFKENPFGSKIPNNLFGPNVDSKDTTTNNTNKSSGSKIDLFGQEVNKHSEEEYKRNEELHRANKETIKEANKRIVMDSFGSKVLPSVKGNAFNDFEENKGEVVTNNNHLISEEKLKDARNSKKSDIDKHIKISMGISDTEDKNEIKKSKKLVRNTKKSHSAFSKQVWAIIHRCEEETKLISFDSNSNIVIGELPIMKFKEVLFKITTENLTKEDKKAIRISLVPVIRDLAYMSGIARFKTVKLLDFSEIQFLPDLINLITRCSIEEGTDADLLKQFEQLFIILNELENIYGLSKALELATYRYMRLMYVLLVYGAKGDLAILSDFIALQIQLI